MPVRRGAWTSAFVGYGASYCGPTSHPHIASHVWRWLDYLARKGDGVSSHFAPTRPDIDVALPVRRFVQLLIEPIRSLAWERAWQHMTAPSVQAIGVCASFASASLLCGGCASEPACRQGNGFFTILVTTTNMKNGPEALEIPA